MRHIKSTLLLALTLLLVSCGNGMVKELPGGSSDKGESDISGTVTFLKVLSNQIIPTAHAQEEMLGDLPPAPLPGREDGMGAPIVGNREGLLNMTLSFSFSETFSEANDMDDVVGSFETFKSAVTSSNPDITFKHDESADYDCGIVIATITNTRGGIVRIATAPRQCDGEYKIKALVEADQFVKISSFFLKTDLTARVPGAMEAIYREGVMAVDSKKAAISVDVDFVTTQKSFKFNEAISLLDNNSRAEAAPVLAQSATRGAEDGPVREEEGGLGTVLVPNQGYASTLKSMALPDTNTAQSLREEVEKAVKAILLRDNFSTMRSSYISQKSIFDHVNQRTAGEKTADRAAIQVVLSYMDDPSIDPTAAIAELKEEGGLLYPYYPIARAAYGDNATAAPAAGIVELTR